MPSGLPAMKTAVPGTRRGGFAARSAKNWSRGSSTFWSRFHSTRRPRFQVVITAKSAAATTSGNQPPCRIFSTLAVKNASSTAPNTAHSPAARGRLQCHRRRAAT